MDGGARNRKKSQNPAGVETRVAGDVKGWVADGITQLWAQAIEEGLKGGDGSSSEVRGSHAGVSADVGKHRMANEGESGHQKEGSSDAWRGRAGGGGGALHGGGRGMHYIGIRTEQWSSRAQRKEMRGEKRSRTQV
jgi:hypothetical protein